MHLDPQSVTVELDDIEVTASDLIGYFHPREVVSDPELTVARKRALLAHWASDIHALASAPALRCVNGITTTIDDLCEAMRRLDLLVDQQSALTTAGIYF